jgi:hypothetical protein
VQTLKAASRKTRLADVGAIIDVNWWMSPKCWWGCVSSWVSGRPWRSTRWILRFLRCSHLQLQGQFYIGQLLAYGLDDLEP